MKRIIMAVFLVVFAVGIADAGRRSARSGTVKDNVFQDKKFGFKLTINKDWKYSLRKEKDNFRLLLTKRKYDIPADYINAPDYTRIPKIVVWTDTTSLPTFSFLDSLVSDSWKSKQKKELLNEFDIIAQTPSSGTKRERAIPRGRKPVKLGGEQAILWKARSTYVKDVATSAAALSGKKVYGSYGGMIVVVKKGKRVIAFHMMTEWQYFDALLKEALDMISTLEFGDPADAAKVDKGKG